MQHLNPFATSTPEQSELGKSSEYDPHYNADKLFPIPRQAKRDELGISPLELPFYGFDCWNHYEVSWLNKKGKPEVAVATIVYPCSSPNIIESKSMKLYFNSLNNTSFQDAATVEALVTKDLTARVGADVSVRIIPLHLLKEEKLYPRFTGINIDTLDVACDTYHVVPEYLTTLSQSVENEILCSDLLKSNCLVTGQPDWGSIQIQYTGKKIDPEGLLKYLVSFRNHNEFHEQCIERIFMDITRYCQPQKLAVYGRYTRRGGLDINPYRSSENDSLKDFNFRLFRQ